MATKRCIKCSKLKPHSDFYKSVRFEKYHDGYDYYCKYCRNQSSLITQRTNTKPCSVKGCKDRHYAKSYCRKHYARQYRNGTTEALNGSVDIHNLSDSDLAKVLSLKKTYLMRTYHLTLDEYVERASKGCEICSRTTERNLHVDHDHSCCPGVKSCGYCVRGIICNKCNIAVDKYENNKMRQDYPNIKLIEEYLRKYA